MIKEIEEIKHEAIDHQELWERFQGGDVEAYELLFKLYYRDLYGYGIKFCSRPELAKDTIQELFVTLWERKGHLADVDSIKAYLLTSLRRLILRKINRQRSRQLKLKKSYITEGFQFSAEELVVTRELKIEQEQQLKNAIESLPERQKETVYLRYYSGMSYREIEVILSINYQSVRNHIYRATQKLKEILEEKEYKAVISLLLVLQIL